MKQESLLKGLHCLTDEDIVKTGVYRIEHLSKPGYFYVGSTSSVKISSGTISKGFYLRWRGHLWQLKKKTHRNKRLQSVYNKYGKEGLRFTILEVVSFENPSFILEREQYWLDFYDAYRNGYNGRPDVTLYKKNKIGFTKGKVIIKYDQAGNVLASYNSARIAYANGEGSYKHISACCLGKRVTVLGFVWRFAEDSFDKYETKPKLDVSIKSVSQYTLNGVFVKKYRTISEASKITKITLSNISMCLRNQRSMAGGFLWKI